MGLRVFDIGFGGGHRLLWPRIAGSSRRLHRGVELAEADRGKLADEASEIAEMVGGSRMRYAGLARHRAQGQPGEPITLQYPFGGLQQRVAQRAVMIGRRTVSGAGAPLRSSRPARARRCDAAGG